MRDTLVYKKKFGIFWIFFFYQNILKRQKMALKQDRSSPDGRKSEGGLSKKNKGLDPSKVQKFPFHIKYEN